jgi:NDP-sugar pyrophosphorylase family protein
MLFAAGLGTRLKPFTDHHPKALAPVLGKTLLERNILYLQQFGINEVVVNVHHFADQIEQVLMENNGFGSLVHISDERDQVLETGGGLLKAYSFFSDEDFVVMNVDMLTNLDLKKLILAHQSSQALATLAVMQRSSSRQLLFDTAMQLCGWRNNSTGEIKASRPLEHTSDFAFSGIQIINSSFFQQVTHSGKFSIIDAYLKLAETLTIKGFDHSGDLVIDVGKPDSLLLAERLFS